MVSRRLVRLAVLGSVIGMWGCQDQSDAANPAAEDLPSVEAMAAADLPNPFSDMARPWGDLPAGREWGQVSAIDLDSDGMSLWIAERCGGSSCVASLDLPVVLKMTPEGQVATSFGAGMFIRPHGVHVDSDGNVWVTDHQNARAEQLEEFPDAAGIGQQVFKFSPDGEVLLALGTAGEPGDPPMRLNNPTDVITAPNGDIFVSEGHSNANPPGRVSKYSSDGTFLMSFGQFGEGPGEFRTPHGMAFDSQGRLFVADRGNSRVQIFDQEGNLLDSWHQFGRPNDVFIDADDTIYVIDSESGAEDNPGYLRGIYIGSAATGEVTGFIPGHPHPERPEGTHGEGLVVDEAGNLFVAEVSLSGMTKYSP